MLLLSTLCIGALGILLTTALHFEVVSHLDSGLKRNAGAIRWSIPLIVASLVAAHLVEIGIYALLFRLGATPFGLGHFRGARMGSAEYFYFSAEAYSSFGYGDIVPTGGLRLVAGIAPLNGLLLLAWSGSFLYAAVHQKSSGHSGDSLDRH